MHTPETSNARRAQGDSLTRRLSPNLLCLALALFAAACSNANRTEPDGAKAGATPASAARAVASSSANSPGAATPKSALPAEIAESKIEDTDGGEFSLADYKGKIVVLDLWATWCGPCRQEVPHLVEIQNEYGGRGVQVVGITVDRRTTPDEEESATLVRDFSREYKINYKLGWTNDEVDKLIAYGRGSIPQTLIINRDGKVLLHQVGFGAGLPQKIRAIVDQALTEQG